MAQNFLNKAFLKLTFQKKFKQGGRGHGIAKDIEKKECGNSRGEQEKIVKFPKVLVSDLGISPLVSGVGISPFHLEFPPCLDFFWNSLMASKSSINT